MKQTQQTEKQNPSFQLSVGLYNALGKLLRKLRKEAGKQPFSSTEQATLALLESNNKMLPSEIADAHHISAQGVSQIVNRLSEQGCIDKHPDDKDKRKIYLSLNDQGMDALLSIRESRSKWLSKAVDSNLDKKEKEILQQAVTLLNRLANTKEKEL